MAEGCSIVSDRDGSWPDQSRTYGAQYHDVYQHFFPSGPGRSVAQALADRASDIADQNRPSLVELGVGTGRVALPLVELGIDVLGVDSSPELLDVIRRGPAPQGSVGARLDLELGDIRTWTPRANYDVAACVCATISMFGSDREREAVLRVAHDSVHGGGAVIVETHDPRFVGGLHSAADRLDFDFPARGLDGVVGRSMLDGTRWQLDLEWVHDGERRSGSELSRLIEPSELIGLAERSGLQPRGVYETWADLRNANSVEDTTGTHPAYIIEFEPQGVLV